MLNESRHWQKQIKSEPSSWGSDRVKKKVLREMVRKRKTRMKVAS